MGVVTTPRRVYVTAVASEGTTPLNAFDSCLVKAGLPQISLIKVTSILPPDVVVVEKPPEFPPGSNVPSIYSYTVSSITGQRISGAIVLGFTSRYTLVVEYTDVNISKETAEQKVMEMVREMANIRGVPIQRTLVKSTTHVVKKTGCVLVLAAEFD